MGPGKALLFLEFVSLRNSLKRLKQKKGLAFLCILVLGVFIINVLSFWQGESVQWTPLFHTYLKHFLAGFLFFSLGIQLYSGTSRLRLNIPHSSAHLLLSLPVKSQTVVMYYFYKQVLFQGVFTLMALYLFLAGMGRTFLPQGMGSTWLGYFLFTAWAQSLALLIYGLNRRVQLEIRLLVGIILGSSAAYLLGTYFFQGQEAFVQLWDTLSLGDRWPVAWFFPTILHGLFPGDTIPLWSLFQSVALCLSTVIFIPFVLPDCREEIMGAVAKQKELLGHVEPARPDMDMAMYHLLGAGRGERFSSWRPGSGGWKALLWRELIRWERIKLREERLTIPFLVLLTLILAWATMNWNFPFWLFFAFPILLSAGRGRPGLDLERSLIQQIPASGREKLLGVSLLPLLEGSVHSGFGALVYIVYIVIAGGGTGEWSLPGFFILSLALPIPFTFLGILCSFLTGRLAKRLGQGVSFLLISLQALFFLLPGLILGWSLFLFCGLAILALLLGLLWFSIGGRVLHSWRPGELFWGVGKNS